MIENWLFLFDEQLKNYFLKFECHYRILYVSIELKIRQMKTFTFIILCFLCIPFTIAQEMKVLNDKHKLFTYKHFRFDTAYAKIPNLAKERNLKEDYFKQNDNNQGHIYAQILKSEQQFIPGVIFNSIDQMPIVVPENVGNMPVYIPDSTVHYHMKILKIEPANTPNLIPLQ